MVLCIILILIIIPLVLSKNKLVFPNTPPAGNLPKSNVTIIPTQITEKLCDPFPAVKGEFGCLDAVKRAIEDTKGSIKNIAIGAFNPDPTNKKNSELDKKMWLIDILLEKPFTSYAGKKVDNLRIAIPIDGSKGLYRMPIKP